MSKKVLSLVVSTVIFSCSAALADDAELKPAIAPVKKPGLFTRLFRRNSATGAPVPAVVPVKPEDVQQPEKMPQAVGEDRTGKVYIVGNPNPETIDRAVKNYKANQIAAGKMKRPWYKPTKADSWRLFRTRVQPVATTVFAAIAAFK